MKYHIPQIPYNITIPNNGGSNPRASVCSQPGCEPPSKLPQHLRSALAGGLCRLQPVTTIAQPLITCFADTPPTPCAAATGSSPSEPDPLAAREEQLIGQLVTQLDARVPGRHTSRQLIIQALRYYLNHNVPADQPTTQLQNTTTTSAGRPAEIIDYTDS